MRFRFWTMALAFGGLVAATSPAHAGCGGGGGCGMMMCGMGMGGMGMGGMTMPMTQASPASMPGMNMNRTAPVSSSMPGMDRRGAVPTSAAPASSPAAPTAPAIAGATYYCPMHPGVMSTFPATCPYCRMALKKR